MGVFDGFRAVIGPVRRRLLPDPQADAERFLAPPLRLGTPDDLAGADQGRGPLELLEREQPKRVPHQHRNAGLAGPLPHDALEPPQAHHERRQTQVRLRLAAAGREPQQVGNRVGPVAAVLVVQVARARQVQQNEGDLEWAPTAVLGHIHVLELYVLAASHLLREHGMDALLPHGPVGKPERLGHLGVGRQ